jgi:hypothetical protein
MLSEFNNMPVNWVDGMKISRKHFQQEENFTNELVKDAIAAQLSPFNFGILPAEKSLDVEVQCDFSQQITVDVTNCNAITPNGSRIYIIPSYSIKKVTHFKEIAERYSLQLAQPQTLYILLSVNPFERIPYGEPAVDENPPRHPFTRPEINLDILPVDQIKTLYLGNVLVLGKISFVNGELFYQKEYIPPCSSVESLLIVKEWYQRFTKSLDSWEYCCHKIIEKIRVKGQVNVLTTCIGQVAEKLVFQIAGIRTYYRWMIPNAAPVYLCEVLIRLLQYLNTTMHAFSPSNREEVMNYFNEWTDLLQGNIERQVIQTLQIQYDHYDLHKIFSTIYQTFSLYQQIFEKLVQLEYIGKHKGDSKIYIEQKVEVPPVSNVQSEKASRWSPLD